MPNSESDPNNSENTGDLHSGASEESSEAASGQERSKEHLRKELGRSEGRFELLVQAVKEYAIFMLDTEGYIQSWNKGAERIKGYSKDEIIGKHFSNFYTEEDRKAGRPWTGLRSAKEEGQWTDEGWRVRKDGSRFWARVTITALFDEEGELRGFAKVTRDMTERHNYEKELTEQKAKADRENAFLHLMQRAAAIANETTSLEDALQKTTEEVANYTGWPVGHVYWLRLGEPPSLVPSDIWHIRDEKEFEAFRSVTEAANFDVGESLPGMVASQGKPVWIPDVTEEPNFVRAKRREDIGVKGAFAVPVRVSGETVAVLEFFSAEREEEDERLIEAIESVGLQLSRVAERERAQQALEESEEQFRNLAENALVGIGLIQEGTYEYLNPALAQITGYSREEILGESPELFIHPDDWPRVRDLLKRRLQRKVEDIRYETRFKTKSGETRHVEVAGTTITYQGKPAIIGTIQDVTERRRMQREMIRVQEEERRRIGQDLHDSVASQLTGANIKLNLLRRNTNKETAEDIEEIQEIIEESAGDVRRLSRGLNPGGLSEGDLSSALRELAENIEGGRFEELLEEEKAFSLLDESSVDGEAATHLYRIAQEALNNARKYASASEISIRLKEGGNSIILEIEDDGKGFNPEEMTEEGLGLRSMRHRADLLGAELVIDSSPGEGTLVQCRLPL